MSHNEARDQRRCGRGTVEGRQRQRWRMQPTLLALEDRRLLSTIVVNNPTDTPDTGQIDLRQAIVQANTSRGGRDDRFRQNGVQDAADDHPDGRPARAERHERDGDDHGPEGGRDGQRRRDEPGVPGRRGCHRVDLGNDDHRRQRRLRSGGGLVNDGGTVTLTNCTVSGNSAPQRHLHRHRRRRGQLGGTTTLTNCTVSGNSRRLRRRPVHQLPARPR